MAVDGKSRGRLTYADVFLLFALLAAFEEGSGGGEEGGLRASVVRWPRGR